MRWDEELEKRVEAVLGNAPKQDMEFRGWQPMPDRRPLTVDYEMKAAIRI